MNRPPPTQVRSRLLLLLAAAAVLLAALVAWRLLLTQHPVPPQGTTADLAKLAAELAALEAREQVIAETVWAHELLAQESARSIERLWDNLNRAADKWTVLRKFRFEELLPGLRPGPEDLPHGIQEFAPTNSSPSWSHDDWIRFLARLESEGWRLGPLEFRHNQFDIDSNGRPDQSLFYFAVHLDNPATESRASLQGDLIITWDSASPIDPSAALPARHIDASRLTLLTRTGPVPFEPILHAQVKPPKDSFFIDPLILYDLDGNGSAEIILASSNTLFRRGPDGRYHRSSLCVHPPGRIFTAVIADFDGDGSADLLCADFEGLLLYRGSPSGTFDQPPERVWTADVRLRYGQVLTCGDINRNGHLDVFLGQYRPPYERGQMPTPYHNANDGHPSWLLENDGRGRFHDVTQSAGLGPKRWRRVYSASLVDLTGNGACDLVVVSDFAGVDLYTNDGHGVFTDGTRAWIPEPRAFGMGHALADFNRNARLDLLVLGMHCPTAQRLDHLQLTRPGHEQDDAARAAMTYGNRLYLARPDNRFEQTALNDSIARTGWSWACATFDLDNNGWPDVYIVNGHETRLSVRDYEPEFWLHDIYVADSNEDVVRTAYFGAKFARTRGRGHSYGGYEINRLHLNLQAQRFVDVAPLLGVAFQHDSRNVVAEDLDGDGRVDLILTTFEVWPEERQTLRVFRNQLEPVGNWIGFRFREEGPNASPVGVRVTLHHAAGSTVRTIVTGDGHRTQNAPTIHFGLGDIDQVDRVEIQWPDRHRRVLQQPAPNRYHLVLRFGA